MPGSARDEAERLVAAVLGSLSVAANGAGENLANGSPECCVCPVCRAIAALRDPDPRAAERLAAGAGNVAAAVANMLRALGGTGTASGPPGAGGAGTTSTARAEPDAGGAGTTSTARAEPDAGQADTDDPWRAATRGTSPTPPAPRKPMAKKAVKKKAAP